MAIQQHYLNRARERRERFHKILFHSELIMVHTTMYDCNLDLKATWAEKAKLAKSMALLEIEKEIADVKLKWFSKRKVFNLLREKEALLQL